jgi:hypothetical protein
MIELTEQQIESLARGAEQPPQVVNPRTQERFVLLRTDDYERIKEEYADSPWTRDEIEALNWARIERDGEAMEEYDRLPEKP